MSIELNDFSWDRMIEAVEAVRERALRSTAALRDAGIPYAVAGGNAVAEWVSRVDRGAVRNTQDVEILVRRSDFDVVKTALEAVGFVYRELPAGGRFVDGPDSHPRDSVNLFYAGEKVRNDHAAPAPQVTDVERASDYDVLSLEALVRMKLTSFRRDDCVDLRDLLEVGLIDETWLPSLLPEHAERLQQLIDDPDG